CVVRTAFPHASYCVPFLLPSGAMTAVHREEGLSQYRAYDSRGQLIAVKDTQGHETRYEYNIAGDLTAVIAPDGSRNGTQYDAWGKAVRTT
ncbi:hypothetical protein, partial [Escherichia coli]|uniref:hypothetical protein n=1 Tax=Escherichia coli TaxID=562 RepID=UPI0040677933